MMTTTKTKVISVNILNIDVDIDKAISECVTEVKNGSVISVDKTSLSIRNRMYMVITVVIDYEKEMPNVLMEGSESGE